MRNFNFLILVFTFLLSISYQTFAQEIIIEKNRSIDGSQVNNREFSNKINYELISEEEDTKIFFNNNSSENENSNLVDDFTLTVNLVYPSGQYSPIYVTIFDEGEFYDNQSMTGSNTFVFNVPKGVYDIVSFSREETTDWQSYVIKEQVNVNEDLVVNIDLTEADNLITIKFLDENGDDLKPGEVDPDTGEIIGGTANVYATTYLYFDPKNWTPFVSYYLWENSAGNNGEFWNLFISDVSERYSVIHTNMGIGYNGKGYASKYETLTDINNSKTLQNDPDEWVLHHESFQPTLMGEEQGTFYYGLSTWDTYEGMGLSGWGARLFTDEANIANGLDIYLNNPLNDDPVDLLIYPLLEDYYGTVDPSYGDESFQINGNPILLDENRGVIYGSGSTSTSFYFTGYDYNANEEGVVLLPFHPKFSYPAAGNENIVMGNNVPVSITSYNGMYVKATYMGRYGETRESDIFDIGVEVFQNGTSIFNGSYSEFLFTEPIEDGSIEISLTNNNSLIEGINGSTSTTLIFDAGNNNDNAPPTLQMLQFRDDEGKVTDRFSTSEEGSLRLAAGDFEYVPDSRTYIYKAGNTVEFFYRVLGQNDWMQLELTQYPEHFFSPGFGDYYEASLGEIENSENDVWYDVKIVCTDAAGNSQEQTVSPAFKLNSTMGMSEAEINSDLIVYPNPFSGELNIQLTENLKGSYLFRISDLTGKTIHSNYQNSSFAKSFIWNGKHLPKGIYILTIENNGKTIAKKIIKK